MVSWSIDSPSSLGFTKRSPSILLLVPVVGFISVPLSLCYAIKKLLLLDSTSEQVSFLLGDLCSVHHSLVSGGRVLNGH